MQDDNQISVLNGGRGAYTGEVFAMGPTDRCTTDVPGNIFGQSDQWPYNIPKGRPERHRAKTLSVSASYCNNN